MHVVETRTPEEDPNAVDHALVVRFNGGDRGALAELYRRHAGRVQSVARSVVGPSSELEDIVQNVFIEVQRSLPRFRGDSRFTTWLHRVTVNVSLQYIRKGQRKGWLRWVGLDRVAPVGRAGLQGHVEAREEVGILYEILAEVGEKKRVVFTLFEIEGLSLDEIASTVGCGVNTVKSRLFHARKEVHAGARRRGILPARHLEVVR
jgi:RNA polymerase sigma-70 factor (ECF subfamily)